MSTERTKLLEGNLTLPHVQIVRLEIKVIHKKGNSGQSLVYSTRLKTVLVKKEVFTVPSQVTILSSEAKSSR